MSYSLQDEKSEWPLDKVARCKVEHPRPCGIERDPRHPDERGACLVIDLVAGGRWVARPEPTAPKRWLQVTLLPSLQ